MMMYPSFRYQLRDQLTPVPIYYGVLVVMILLNLLYLPFGGAEANLTVTSGGITAVTMLFAFIVSLCAFKESFLFQLQHGVSRRTQFVARMGAVAALCGIFAVADEVYTLFVALLSIPFPKNFFAHSLYEIFYASTMTTTGPDFTYTVSTSGTTVLLSVVFSFFVLLATASFGYLVTTLNYRLNKAGKIAFWCGCSGLLIVGSTVVDTNSWLAKALLDFVLWMVRVCFSTLPRLCLSCLLLTALFSGLSWLLMRRAHVKGS